MTFDEFWDKLRTTNNLDRCERMRLRVDELKRILRVAYDAGHESGRATAEDIAGGLFDGLFGKGR
jgi:hypothetical protein